MSTTAGQYRGQAADDAIGQYLELRTTGLDMSEATRRARRDSLVEDRSVSLFESLISAGVSVVDARADAVAEAVADGALSMYVQLRGGGMSAERAASYTVGDSPVAASAVRRYEQVIAHGHEQDLAVADAINSVISESSVAAVAAQLGMVPVTADDVDPPTRVAVPGRGADGWRPPVAQPWQRDDRHAVTDGAAQPVTAGIFTPPFAGELDYEGFPAASPDHGYYRARGVTAVERYQRLLAGGIDAAVAQVEAAGDSQVAADAISRYVVMTASGLDPLVAHEQAVSDAADQEVWTQVAFDRRIARERAERAERDADDDGHIGEYDVNDADWRTPWRTDIPERAAEPGSWIARQFGATPDALPDVIDVAAERADAVRAQADLAAGMSGEQAREIVARGDELNRHLRTCTDDTLGCGMCAQQLDGRLTSFWRLEYPAATALLADRADGVVPVDEPDVTVIDPAQLMPADVALHNYGVASDAVERFELLRADGVDADTAARQAVVTDLADIPVAHAAVESFRRLQGSGIGDEAARSSAVVDAADRATPRISTEQADRFTAAFTGPADGTVASEFDDLAAARAAVATLPDGSISPEDLARVGVTPEQFSRLVDESMDADARAWHAEHELDLLNDRAQLDANGADGPAIPEQGPEPGSWIARNLPSVPATDDAATTVDDLAHVRAEVVDELTGPSGWPAGSATTTSRPTRLDPGTSGSRYERHAGS
ncbi:hypothetical protein [Amycolatopsis sp. H20-H5]|uniref:hypothetical protein n=1 Tax=Amycolatopsis sp. H20-H5 TaxID=3046309 RepID=UPI002DBCC549|nr:hypothetical protein [Amycolatopsis sp. H20-H5]MEC3976242.1 hypothetical protein [Amycolatopsis sp. H20-H5]